LLHCVAVLLTILLLLLVETSVVGTLELREVGLMHVRLLSWVVSVRLGCHVRTWHHLLSHTEIAIERLLSWTGEPGRASVVEKDTVVLRICLVIHRGVLREVMVAMLLALEAKVDLLLDLLLKLLRLLSGHKLLSVLVGVGQLTATFVVKILLWTDISVGRRLSEG